jgi:hypothetical protein
MQEEGNVVRTGERSRVNGYRLTEQRAKTMHYASWREKGWVDHGSVVYEWAIVCMVEPRCLGYSLQ